MSSTDVGIWAVSSDDKSWLCSSKKDADTTSSLLPKGTKFEIKHFFHTADAEAWLITEKEALATRHQPKGTPAPPPPPGKADWEGM